jgi:hypothetical protein
MAACRDEEQANASLSARRIPGRLIDGVSRGRIGYDALAFEAPTQGDAGCLSQQ